MKGQAVVLAHGHDLGAMAVAAQLASGLGPEHVTVLRPEILALSRWRHRLGSNSEVQTDLRSPQGVQLASSEVSCLFNRLQYLQSPRFSGAAPRDRDYALAELQALVASWLQSLGTRVVNPGGPRGQARGPTSRRGWLALAAGCDLPVARSMAATAGRMIPSTPPGMCVHQREPWPGGVRGPAPVDGEVEHNGPAGDEEEMILVAGDRVVGSFAGAFGTPCREVARRSGCTLLEFRFVRWGGEPVLLDVDPLPALTQPAAVTAVAELLVETAEQHADER